MDWEKQFRDKFSSVNWGGEEWKENIRPDDVVKFISSQRQDLLKELRGEVERMKKGDKRKYCGWRHDLGNFEEELCDGCVVASKALQDVIKVIKNRK